MQPESAARKVSSAIACIASAVYVALVVFDGSTAHHTQWCSSSLALYRTHDLEKVARRICGQSVFSLIVIVWHMLTYVFVIDYALLMLDAFSTLNIQTQNVFFTSDMYFHL